MEEEERGGEEGGERNRKGREEDGRKRDGKEGRGGAGPQIFWPRTALIIMYTDHAGCIFCC